MSIKIGGNDVVDNNRKGIFESANVGTFANPARPGSAAVGDLIWSTTDNQLQVWNGSAWAAAVGAGQAISASGGSEFTIDGWKVHVFNSSSSFTLSNASATLEYFLVGGGGAGGVKRAYPNPSYSGAGGGGAGGVVYGISTFNAGTFTITVGAAGGGGPTFAPAPGGNSSIAHPGGTLTAIGGGAGGARGPSVPLDGAPGGSGGGGAYYDSTGGSGGGGTPGQGLPGGSGFLNPPTFGNGGCGGGWSTPGAPIGAINARATGLGYVNTWNLPASYGHNKGFNAIVAQYSGGVPTTTPQPENTYYAFAGSGSGGSTPTSAFMSPSGSPPYPSTSGYGGNGGPRLATTVQSGENGYGGLVVIRYRPIQ